MNYNCSIFWDLRNLQEQVKKAFCYQKLFWPFTVWINCLSDLKIFAYSRPSASNFESFSQSLEQFFLTVGQYNFGNKIPLYCFLLPRFFLIECASIVRSWPCQPARHPSKSKKFFYPIHTCILHRKKNPQSSSGIRN